MALTVRNLPINAGDIRDVGSVPGLGRSLRGRHNNPLHSSCLGTMDRGTWWVFRSDQIIRSVMSDSLQPHESQHARPPYPSPTPGVHSDSCPSSRWCHPAVSSSVIPFSSCPQSLQASESFPMSQLFIWGSQSTGVSALATFLMGIIYY